METLPAAWLRPEACDVQDLARIVRMPASPSDFPFSSRLDRGVPLYDGGALRRRLQQAAVRQELMSEWVRVLGDGPGVLVLQGAFDDAAIVEAVTHRFHEFIDEERGKTGGGDHFARAGANDRVWNALEKLCMRDPELFARYYGNDLLALVCEAWLGPGYQMTSQVNRVNPGGAAQSPHRDYHLGFLTADAAARYPAHVHRLSPVLTLQGAVAHVDMPPESGPTLYLPHSHKYLPGYLVAAQPAFREVFEAHHVQLPLARGDAVFFNPALMHAAGHNRTAHVRRTANLLQVSSAFGRAMESVDRVRMCRALYPALQHLAAARRLDAPSIDCAIGCCAEGYAFPTDLDLDPPLGGLAPESQQALMRRALAELWSVERFEQALLAQAEKKRVH
ncbi:MAG TPA: phytanoyl-CoA dioxygenase family protein [Burkholderiaceae bacterium]|nr:phytanoyl-CoA dioxygenase family protein [Burkholderiaceae bacterium]